MIRRAETLVGVLASAGAVALVTAAIALAKTYVPVLSLGVLYVFAVLPIAVVWGLAYALPVSIASMLAFNWFFLPPTHTLSLRDSENWFALAVYLVTAIVVSELAARGRRRARDAEQRAREAESLADTARALLEGADIRTELAHIAGNAARALGAADASIELGEGDGGYELRAGGVLVGRLVVASADEPDAAVLARFLPSFASLVAVALEREKLEREDAVKTALLRAVSHDLRSPLTAIAAAVGGLEDTGLRLDAEDRASLLETIRIETDRLGRLIANLLDLSRLEAGAARPRAELWTIDELVGHAIEELRGHDRVSPERLDDLPPVEVDAVQIERVLANLLENALRFSTGPVRITGHADGREVVLEILDDGPGLADDETERVFQPFHHGPAGGTGLGLAIARGFAEANGARLWAEPSPAGGRFVLALPAPHEAPVKA